MLGLGHRQAYIRLAQCTALLITAGCVASSATRTSAKVSGKTQRAISAAISAVCNGKTAGTVTFPNGTYSIDTGLHVPSNCTLEAADGAQVTLEVTNNDYGIYLDGDNVTIAGLTLNGGGIVTTQNSYYAPQHDVNITNNTFQNISSGKNGVASNGYWHRFNIAHNHFTYIGNVVPWNKVTANVSIKDGQPYSGGGITNNCGIDETTIESNAFDHILADGVAISWNWTSSSVPGAYVQANNDQVRYNTFHDIHRIAIEMQGVAGGCPGPNGCVSMGSARIVGLQIKGNFAFHQAAPYYDSMGFSLVVDAASRPVYANNTAVFGSGPDGCSGAGSNGFENAGDDALVQGNVISASGNCRVGRMAGLFRDGFDHAGKGGTAPKQSAMREGTAVLCLGRLQPAHGSRQHGRDRGSL